MSIATGPWNPLGQNSTKRALIYDPITFGYKVMIESNRASGHLGFAKYGGPNGRRLPCPQKISKKGEILAPAGSKGSRGTTGLHLCQISCL